MRILLAGPDSEENLSLRYLSSSLLKAGHDPVLIPFNSPADTMPVADAAQQAEIVGLSMCFQARAQEFLGLAELIKSRDPKKLVVAGGHYASCAAEPLLANHPEIDIIVIHEGERTLVEIADAMSHLEERLPQIPGIAYRNGQQVSFTASRPTLDDLDTLPFPDRRGPVHSIAGVPTAYLMGSRGCYGSCAYCCITALHRMAPGKRFRQRNVVRIAEEMAALYHERGVRQFVFHDDNFLVPAEAMNHARLSAFEQAFKDRGLKDIALVIKCRPTDASREVLRRLKELGLVRVFFGIESATSRGLAALDRIQTVEDSERALEICAELDISAQFTLMIFNPDATLDTLHADVAFMRRFSANPLNFCRAEIYAGTPLEKRMMELGRARGDYLARVYDLSDPGAGLACNISLDLFNSRCWSNGSLMQSAIGLDHLAAVAKRLYRGPRQDALCRSVAGWLRSVNLDTIDLLEEVIELSAHSAGGMNAGLRRALLALKKRESSTRAKFLSEGSNLRRELETLPFTGKTSQSSQFQGPRLRLAGQVAAAVLAIGMPAGQAAVGQQVKTPPPVSNADQDNLCSLTGTVTDSTGAVIPNATITVKNIDTGLDRTMKTNGAGQYAANDLHIGRYTVKAEAPLFSATERSGIVLKKGDRGRADFVLQISNLGCCEYAAVPLRTHEDLIEKRKPFTYMVGDARDNNSFQGIAKLVYGDSRLWVQIFEANRNVVQKPGSIPYGTPILIPPRKRAVPKLVSRSMPVYPPAAEKGHVSGDVVLDVTLKEDGTVARTDVIDGPPLLAEAATSAVQQWRYQPLLLKGKPVLKFVVVVSFGRRITIQ
ncbi:MAG: TonB family protein [Acidobacteriia bacterium]|nr:TonB family protein [Terriglobia bacterium]